MSWQCKTYSAVQPDTLSEVSWLLLQDNVVSAVFFDTSSEVNRLWLQYNVSSAVKNSMPLRLAMFLCLTSISVTAVASALERVPLLSVS